MPLNHYRMTSFLLFAGGSLLCLFLAAWLARYPYTAPDLATYRSRRQLRLFALIPAGIGWALARVAGQFTEWVDTPGATIVYAAGALLLTLAVVLPQRNRFERRVGQEAEY